MRRYFIILCCFTALSVLGSCKKDGQFQHQGILEGPDIKLCPCCGGVILKIGSDFNSRIDSLPGMPVQELYNLSFPKTIHFNSVLRTNCASINYLTITSFEITD